MGMVGNYESVTHNRKTVLVHRLRAEQALGKPLPPKAVVHHADGSTRSDAPLVICQNQKYHCLLHIREKVIRAGGNPNTERICWKCKQVKPMTAFYPSKKQGEGIQKECRRCSDEYRRKRHQAKRAGVA